MRYPPASLLGVSTWTLSLLVKAAHSHAIRRTSLASGTAEPVFTIQTSMPASSTITSSSAYECFSNGSTFLCPTSTITGSTSGEDDPIFCPAPTSLPTGLCYSTITYTISTMSNSAINSGRSRITPSAQVNASTTTSVRMYPCEERTTVYSSYTYAINCLDAQNNYIACRTNVTISPVPYSTKSSDTLPSANSSCFNANGQVNACASSAISTTILTACIEGDCTYSPASSTLTTTRASSSIRSARSTSIINQCFNQNGKQIPCPTLCSDPFETAPGPVLPTATLSLESVTTNGGSISTASEKIFQTSPAPIITSFASAPAFLTSGL